MARIKRGLEQLAFDSVVDFCGELLDIINALSNAEEIKSGEKYLKAYDTFVENVDKFFEDNEYITKGKK